MTIAKVATCVLVVRIAMTKEEAHYGEVHLCSFCRHIQFRYGDYYCGRLEAPVAESGYCDLYEKDGKPTPEKVTVAKKDCKLCTHNMGGMCGKTGELAKKACAMFDDTVIDPVVEKDCTTCYHAYYDDDSIAMCRLFNGALNMADLTACEEYMEDNNEVGERID
jgi:hypothetical protein